MIPSRPMAAAMLLLVLGLGGCAGAPAPAASAPAAPLPLPVAAAPAEAPSVADLVGARAAGAESDLERRGYTVARTRGLTSFWLRPAGACVRVVTSNGRYSTVENVAASNCRR